MIKKIWLLIGRKPQGKQTKKKVHKSVYGMTQNDKEAFVRVKERRTTHNKVLQHKERKRKNEGHNEVNESMDERSLLF